MKKQRKIFALALAIAMILALAACGGSGGGSTAASPAPGSSAPASSAPAPESSAPESPSGSAEASDPSGPVSGGVLTISTTNMPGAINTFKEKSWAVGGTIYAFPAVETLIGRTPEGLAPTKLATAWETAEDGSSITLTLREGVLFHDGTEFNSEAVKWNLEKIKDFKSELKCIESIDCPDEHTVVLNLSEYSNTLLYHLSYYDGCMVSPTSVEEGTEESLANAVVGTGPFKMVSFEQNGKMVFEKFEDYWDEGKPYLDGMEIHHITDSNTARNAFRTGQIQVWDYVPATMFESVKSEGYNTHFTTALIRCGYADSSNPDSPLANQTVRYAIEHAIDKEAIAAALGAGTYMAPAAPCGPNHIGASGIPEGRGYDPEKAKALLAEAGYPNGFEMDLIAQASVNQDMLTAIQGYLLAVGIQAEIVVPDNAAMASYRTEGWKNGLLFVGISTATPSIAQSLQTDGPSPSKASSTLVTEEYSAALNAAAAAIDTQDEESLSAELVKLVYDEAMIIPFTIDSRICAYQSNVHDVDLSGFSIWYWNPGEIWMER